jgi:hypothetical protein
MVRRLYSLKAKLSEKTGFFFALRRKKYISETGAPYLTLSNPNVYCPLYWEVVLGT